MTLQEAAAAVHRRAHLNRQPMTDVAAQELAEELGRDPLLIQLYFKNSSNQRKDPTSVIAGYINSCLNRSSEKPGRDFVSEQYEETLLRFASMMLEFRDWSPSWQTVEAWFAQNTDQLKMLRHLLADRELCSLRNKSTARKLVFRHDRLRDHLLADALVASMRDAKFNRELVSEPYYANILSQALMMMDLPHDNLAHAQICNPLSLFETLRLLQNPKTSDDHYLIEILEGWLKRPSILTRRNRNLLWEAEAILTRIDGRMVLGLAQLLQIPSGKMSSRLLAARLRNGDADAGARFCLRYEPQVGFPFRDQLILHAVEKQDSNFLADVDALLRHPHPIEFRKGALFLAGHIGDVRLSAAIGSAWEATTQPDTDMLAAFIWAAVHCCGDRPEQLLDSMLDCWSALSDEAAEPAHSSPRMKVASELQWALGRNMPLSVLKYLLDRVSIEALGWPLRSYSLGWTIPSL